MKLLSHSDYYKVLKPLEAVDINHLFARSVVEHHVAGKIWVNDPKAPDTFYIQHPYGMSLLFGNPAHEGFNKDLAEYSSNSSNRITGAEWLQAYPSVWDRKLSDLLGNTLLASENESDLSITDAVIRQTRVNFIFNRQRFTTLKINTLRENYRIVKTDTAIFNTLEGSVIPSRFWNNAQDFCRHSVGFSLLHQGKAVSTAFASFIHDRQLELGIETLPAYQGKGLAKYVCAALIKDCITHGFEPVWSCRLSNTGSYTLALQLGFEPSKQIPYYRLSYTKH